MEEFDFLLLVFNINFIILAVIIMQTTPCCMFLLVSHNALMQHDARCEGYLGGENDAPDQLRSCEDLNLLNDLHPPIQQNHFVEESGL